MEEVFGGFRGYSRTLERRRRNEIILVNYEGKYYRLKGVSIDPKPFQKPRPPIMIASWGSEQGLRRVAN